MIMGGSAVFHFKLAVTLVGITCFTPEPGEPAACIAGGVAGASLTAGGAVLGYGAYKAATDEMIPGIKQAVTCTE